MRKKKLPKNEKKIQHQNVTQICTECSLAGDLNKKFE